ncbi:MAG: site-2 protease family protein, partial [Tidjanibacter sp.]|nr:site-2 protease family protein [Tidjanibacter sp.]
GFRDGDLILGVGGERTDDYQRLVTKVLIEPGAEVVVLRDGAEHTFNMPVTSIMDYMEDPDLIAPRYPFDVAEVVEGYGAAEAGIMAGDRLVSLNGTPLRYFDEYKEQLPAVAGSTAIFGIERDSAGVTLRREVAVAVNDDALIGISVDGSKVMKVLTREYSFWGSIPAGVKRVGREISDYWKQVKMMVKPKNEAYKALGGPLSIGNIFPNEWSWERFWNITALLSIILAVMNILPIPALDGGHVLFLLAEVITGRKPNDKFMIYAQTVGMLLLMTLMVYATWNDIMRIFVR